MHTESAKHEQRDRITTVATYSVLSRVHSGYPLTLDMSSSKSASRLPWPAQKRARPVFLDTAAAVIVTGLYSHVLLQFMIAEVSRVCSTHALIMYTPVLAMSGTATDSLQCTAARSPTTIQVLPLLSQCHCMYLDASRAYKILYALCAGLAGGLYVRTVLTYWTLKQRRTSM